MRSITATLFIWTLVLAMAAQQAPPRAPQPAAQSDDKPQVLTATKGTTKFSASATEVVEDVILKDKGGKPIEGLTAKDFIVTEDGKPQTVKFCQFQTLEETVSAPPPAAEGPAVKEETIAAPKLAAAAVKSVTANQIAPEKPGEIKYKDRRLMVMFFDMTSMPIQDQMRAQTAAQKFLKTQMTPSDLMAIMTFSSDVKVVEDFTDDRDKLAKDIKGLIIGEGQGFDATTADDSTSDTGAAFSADDTEFNIFNTDRQLSALETAVKMLGSLTEKKALVYFASGVTRNRHRQPGAVAGHHQRRHRANVSFYPIDARGLVAHGPAGRCHQGLARAARRCIPAVRPARSPAISRDSRRPCTPWPPTPAARRCSTTTTSPWESCRRRRTSPATTSSATTATNDKLDGHFRRIKITLRPELVAKYGKLDYRQGYFASKKFSKFNATDKERQLSEALMLGDPITDIEWPWRSITSAWRATAISFPSRSRFRAATWNWPSTAAPRARSIDFIGEVKDPRARWCSNVRDFMPISSSRAKPPRNSPKRPLAYDTGFTLPPGTYTLKFLARENDTGKIGTYETKFVVPDLTTDTKLLPISSVVLSSQRMDMNSAVFATERDKKLIAANPLVEDGRSWSPA